MCANLRRWIEGQVIVISTAGLPSNEIRAESQCGNNHEADRQRRRTDDFMKGDPQGVDYEAVALPVGASEPQLYR